MEAIGTTAALAQLLGLSIQVGEVAKNLVQSFLNAPKELVQLNTKLGILHSHIKQLHSLGNELSASALIMLFPPEHQTMLSTSLQTNLHMLHKIQSLCKSRTGKSQTITTRLRWAMLDKKKASRILGNVTKAESDLKTVLAIIGARLALLNQNSLGALSASHALEHARMRESTEAVKAWMRVEIQALVNSAGIGSQNYRENVLSPLTQRSQSSSNSLEGAGIAPGEDQDHSTYSENTFNADIEVTGQSKDSIRNQNLVHTKSEFQHRSSRDKRGKELELTSRAALSADIKDHVDSGTRLVQHYMRRSLSYYHVTFGSLRELSTSDIPAIGASVMIQSKRNRRRLRLVSELGFNLFCQQVLRFELNLQLNTRQWTSMPTLDCSMTIFNVRPKDAPIFRACQERDINNVRYLLESGQASVYDADEEIGGLLEHVVQGNYEKYWYCSGRELQRVQPVLDYLLDQGCDPSAFYGTITERRLPAVLFSFDRGYSSAVSAMLSRGADLVSFGPMLAGLFQKVNAGFKWKIELLRAMGHSDWHIESPVAPRLANTILHGACEEANIHEVLFALEIADLDPNLEGVHKRTALGNAAQIGFLKGAVTLVEHGAEVDSSKGSGNGTPLTRSLERGWCSDVTHYLLYQGANPQLKLDCGESTWHQVWNVACSETGNRPSSWSFVRLEGELTHLLLHGSDPFELFEDPRHPCESPHPPHHWYASKLHLRAPEIARSWSYDLAREHRNIAPSEEWICNFENAEERRTPRHTFSWSPSGLIYQESPRKELRYQRGTEAEEYYPTSVGHHENNQSSQTSSIENTTVSDGNGKHSKDSGDKEILDDIGHLQDVDQNDTFFKEQTQFYHHISSSSGRRKLSRFPMALALCDALQFAGYRAEMDDDGDIWYETDDGGRYFDAQENRQEGDRDDSATEFCPICQDFERYGLGRILREAEEAKRELREYREKVNTKRNYCW